MEERIRKIYRLASPCRLCPRRCEVERSAGQKGICKTGLNPRVASYGPHFGEEAPLVGRGGSGTIFFAYCNLKCVFCQNHDISQQGHGYEVSVEELVEMMMFLQARGCHNINFVTPTHVAHSVAEAIIRAREKGLKIPIVYNTGGYDSVETLKILEGLVDIYMPDFKYWKEETALKYSIAPDYPSVARAALKEMHNQVGDLVLDRKGIAVRGLLVRHLVMPGHLDETREILRFIAEEISRDTYINIMDQYRPLYRAGNYQEIARRITGDEYKEAIRYAKEAGLWRLDKENLFRMGW